MSDLASSTQSQPEVQSTPEEEKKPTPSEQVSVENPEPKKLVRLFLYTYLIFVSFILDGRAKEKSAQKGKESCSEGTRGARGRRIGEKGNTC